MSKSERASKAETAFKLFDKNRDGFITREEFTQVSIFLRTNEKQGHKSKHCGEDVIIKFEKYSIR